MLQYKYDDISNILEDTNKMKKIIEKYNDRIPINLFVNKKIELNESKKINKNITNNYNLLKALVPKNMKYHEFILYMRKNYINLKSANNSIICFCNNKLIPNNNTINELWVKNKESEYASLKIIIDTENTFG